MNILDPYLFVDRDDFFFGVRFIELGIKITKFGWILSIFACCCIIVKRFWKSKQLCLFLKPYSHTSSHFFHGFLHGFINNLLHSKCDWFYDVSKWCLVIVIFVSFFFICDFDSSQIFLVYVKFLKLASLALEIFYCSLKGRSMKGPVARILKCFHWLRSTGSPSGL